MSADGKRVVIVTGASRGLGRAIALSFGARGDRLVVNYRERETEAEAVARDIVKAGGDAFAVRANVRDSEAVGEMISRITDRWGRIDILVNNAGMTADGLCLRMSEEDWDRVLGTNLTGPFHCIRAVSNVMSEQKDGQIINISSIVGLQGREGQANYSAAKAGLIGLTRAAARELGRFNIRVNAVLPGYLPTDMGGEVTKSIKKRILRENVLGRVSDPREVAEFVLHLASMRNVSGQVFNLDSRTI
jgi:3-oxoacyl-[acyl-carrier protein] reductase